MNSREPIEYVETVHYFPEDDDAEKPGETDIETDIYIDIRDLYPLGYPTEQYLTKLKNDVQDSFV